MYNTLTDREVESPINLKMQPALCLYFRPRASGKGIMRVRLFQDMNHYNSRAGEKNGSYKHGQINMHLYKVWRHIKTRCGNPNHSQYGSYGGRGIKVCKEWADSFTTFAVWARANGYAENLTIDRVDNNGNYEPANCRWITRYENNTKKSTVKIILAEAEAIRERYARTGETYKEIAKDFNCSPDTIGQIIRGLTHHKTEAEYREARANYTPQQHRVFTDEEKAAIRSRYAAGGITQKELGLIYGVSQRTINVIVGTKRTYNKRR